MRNEVTLEFTKFISKKGITVKSVAIIGGNSRDPEVEVIIRNFPEAEIFYFDIANNGNDANFQELDLNNDLSGIEIKRKFDLVVSSQVLEHIWNHSNFFNTIVNFTNPTGLIWINCPKSNFVHGSPHYYSAGFTSTYLEMNLKHHDCQVLESGEIGNKRYYLAVHLARYWQSPEENEHPIRGYNFQPGSKLGVARKFLKDLPVRLYLSIVPRRDSDGKDFATEAYVGAQRKG